MPAKKALLEPDKIHIVDFKIIKGQINSPFEFPVDKVKGHGFNLSFDLGFNLEDKLIKADFKVEITTESKDENVEEARGGFQFVFIYHVENLHELAISNKKNNRIELNGGLGNALASITYSTSRGILMTRFQGTALEKFILPVIDPNQLLNKENK